MKYKRALLKLSGEAFGGSRHGTLDFKCIQKLAEEFIKLQGLGLELAVVVGGGNIFRGRSIPEDSIPRATADYMGMIGTLINALALQAEIEKFGSDCRVLTALSVKEVAEDYIHRQALDHLGKGKIVLFAAGTGNPFFTTDTAAALRALEVGADVLLKATNVDGVYSRDPNGKGGKAAKKFTKLTFHKALVKRLQVMDSTAFSLCQDNKLPIIVFKHQPGAIAKILAGEAVGTLVE